MKLGEDPTPLPRKRKRDVQQTSKKKDSIREKLVEEMSGLDYYKGKNILAVSTTSAPTVFRLNEKKVDSWGLVYNPKKGVTLRCEKRNYSATLLNFCVKGCTLDTTAKNPECFLLLKDKKEKTFTCVGLTGEWTLKLDQERCNRSGWREVLGYEEGRGSSVYRRRIMDWETFPAHNEVVEVASVANFIVSFLEWTGLEIPDFQIERRVGATRKEKLEKRRAEPASAPRHLSIEVANELFDRIRGRYDGINIFNNRTFHSIDVPRCHFAPDGCRCRPYQPEYTSQLANSFLAYSGVAFPKRILALCPIKWEPPEDNCDYNGTPFDQQPTIQDIATCHFWIIGGQHTIMAYRLLAYDYEVDMVPAQLREDLKTTEAIMFWNTNEPGNNELMMSLSLTLNDHHNTNMDDPEFLLIAQQVRNLWIKCNRPTSSSRQADVMQNYQRFCAMARYVIPWARGQDPSKKLSLKEMSSFIFSMDDATFALWMRIYDFSMIGALISFNAKTQAQVRKDINNYKEFSVPKLLLTSLQGLSGEKLRRVAEHLLEGTKISLYKDKPKHKTYDPKQAGKFKTVKEYATRKKTIREFMLQVIRTFADADAVASLRDKKDFDLKTRFIEECIFFKIDPDRRSRLWNSLGKEWFQHALMKNKRETEVPAEFKELCKFYKAGVDKNGNAIRISSENKIKFFDLDLENQHLFKSFQSKRKLQDGFAVFFVDCIRGIPCHEWVTRDFLELMKMVAEIGRKTSHIIVIIAEPRVALRGSAVIHNVAGYEMYMKDYIQPYSDGMTEHLILDNEGLQEHKILYAFYNNHFLDVETDLSTCGSDKVLFQMLSGGKLRNFRDNSTAPSSGFLSRIFVKQTLDLCVRQGDVVAVFNPSGGIVQLLLERGNQIGVWCSPTLKDMLKETADLVVTTCEPQATYGQEQRSDEQPMLLLEYKPDENQMNIDEERLEDDNLDNGDPAFNLELREIVKDELENLQKQSQTRDYCRRKMMKNLINNMGISKKEADNVLHQFGLAREDMYDIEGSYNGDNSFESLQSEVEDSEEDGGSEIISISEELVEVTEEEQFAGEEDSGSSSEMNSQTQDSEAEEEVEEEHEDEQEEESEDEQEEEGEEKQEGKREEKQEEEQEDEQEEQDDELDAEEGGARGGTRGSLSPAHKRTQRCGDNG